MFCDARKRYSQNKNKKSIERISDSLPSGSSITYITSTHSQPSLRDEQLRNDERQSTTDFKSAPYLSEIRKLKEKHAELEKSNDELKIKYDLLLIKHQKLIGKFARKTNKMIRKYSRFIPHHSNTFLYRNTSTRDDRMDAGYD